MDLFLINIGNTRVQSAAWVNGETRNFSSLPTARATPDIIPVAAPAAGACVVPEKQSVFGDRVFWVSPNLDTGLNLSTLEVSTIGADRLANAAALAAFHRLPAVCVDCGTAITFDVVDHEKRYLGGAIAPGRALARRALRDHTAQLPDIPLINELRPVIGSNTTDALLSGTDRGLVCLVKGLVEHINREIDETCQVVLTGGDAAFFLPHLSGAIDGGVDMTLKGIVTIWKKNQS